MYNSGIEHKKSGFEQQSLGTITSVFLIVFYHTNSVKKRGIKNMMYNFMIIFDNISTEFHDSFVHVERAKTESIFFPVNIKI